MRGMARSIKILAKKQQDFTNYYKAKMTGPGNVPIWDGKEFLNSTGTKGSFHTALFCLFISYNRLCSFVLL